MARRLKLTVAYDGGPFAGWQSQVNGNAIQDHLEKSFAHISGTKVRVHGAGRTDAGVHALAQIAHADIPESRLSGEQWTAALNSALPPAIRILRCQEAKCTFHARFDAKGKLYRYRIWNARVLPPLEHGRAWHVASELDFDLMKSEAEVFVGRHDFAAFTANRGTPAETTVRRIESVRMKRSGDCVTIEIGGDGFLYKMVRLIVGALVECGRGKAPPGLIRERLKNPAGYFGKGKLVAPAAGLFLVRVRY